MTPEEYEILFGEPMPLSEQASPPPPVQDAPPPPPPEPFSVARQTPPPPPVASKAPTPPAPPPPPPAQFSVGRPTPPPQPQTAAPTRFNVPPKLRRKRVLIPAGIFGLFVLSSALGGNTNDAGDTVETDLASDAMEDEVVATAPTTTSTTTTTTAPVAAALVESSFAIVGEDEVTQARDQLQSATVVAQFEGFSDYDRDTYDGGGWPDSDGDCQSDRHEILIEESLVETELNSEGCRVETGLWIDPYDGTEYTEASQVSIDHVIPLAAAHRAGAWRWGEQSRRAFASDISFPATHAAVGVDVNQSKADSGPEVWRPPSEDAWCRYAVDWTAVKTRWSLEFTEDEVAALEEMLDTCEPADGTSTEGSLAGSVSPTTTEALQATAAVVAPQESETTQTEASSTPTTAAVATTQAPTTQAPTTAAVVTEAPAPVSDCHPNYSPCLPNLPGNALNCGDISAKNIQVSGGDPYRLDADGDGVGCES